MANLAKDHTAETLLRRAHSPETANTIFRERVKRRPLLLRPTSPVPGSDARAKRQYERLQKAKKQRKSNKPQPLSAKRKRALCLYEIPKEQQKYEIYEPLHRMWCGYVREILGLDGNKRQYVDAQTAGPILVSADYHGALVEVVRSRCVSRVGLKGIVVKDTKYTFEVVTRKDELKTVPKEHTVFKTEIPLGVEDEAGSGESESDKKHLVFELHGNQFEARAPDRANRKVKWHLNLDEL